MVTIGLDYLFLMYMGAGGLAIFGLWFFCGWGRVRYYEYERNRSVFHCVKCGELYALKNQEKALMPCPKCQFKNSRLRF